MAYKVAHGKLHHNGVVYKEGDTVKDIADADAEILASTGKLKRVGPVRKTAAQKDE